MPKLVQLLKSKMEGHGWLAVLCRCYFSELRPRKPVRQAELETRVALLEAELAQLKQKKALDAISKGSFPAPAPL